MSVLGPDWVPVFEGSRLQCDLVAGVLDANGVDVMTPAGSAEWVGAVFENSAVWVRKEMVARAREIIDAAQSQGLSGD